MDVKSAQDFLHKISVTTSVQFVCLLHRITTCLLALHLKLSKDSVEPVYYINTLHPVYAHYVYFSIFSSIL